MPEDSEDAFAATVAPSSEGRAHGSTAGAPPERASASIRLGNDATMAAPSSPAAPLGPQALPPLPEVDHTLYRTDREIARGGMGRILAAEDRRLTRPVALKELLDPAPQHVSRFQREALITARLQHPGIVPVYEAGRWPSGEPFFAMKLVQGRPLDAIIAGAKTLQERLALLPRLASACDAIAYAHNQRIIHRDLKPSNVLLGDFGETVVIDWGLAKDLDAVESPESAERSPRVRQSQPMAAVSSNTSTLTVAGAVMGTPAYMPPEQAVGASVDSRSDVFALGAMLYHTLCGAPPYNARTAEEVISAASIGKVVPLVDREPDVPPELAAIVARAMAREPKARYAHAGELADELRRYLTGQLVGAHRYTPWQHIGRFVRRHRAAVTIGTVAVIGFAVGGSIAVHNIVSARDEARRSERIATTRKKAAENLIEYTMTHVKTQLASIGRLDLLTGLGGEVEAYYDQLAHIPGGMAIEDKDRMVDAIELMGSAEHTSGKPDLALKTWHQARDKIDKWVGGDLTDRTFHLRRMRARLDVDIAGIDVERGNVADAERELIDARREWDALEAEKPQEHDVWLSAADTHDRLGDLFRTEGKLDHAFDEYTEAKKEREHATGGGNGRVSEELRSLATSHLKLGTIYQNRGESSLALDEYGSALQLRQRLAGDQPNSVEYAHDVVDTEDVLADLQRVVGDDRAARATYERALPVTEMLVTRDAENTDWQRQRGDIFAGLGFVLVDSGRFKDAVTRIEEAIKLQEALVARDAKRTGFAVDLSRSLTRLGDARVGLGALDDAVAVYQRAADMRRDLVARDHSSVPFRRSLAWSLAKLAHVREIAGDTGHAQEAAEQALALRRKLADEAPAQGGFKNELAASEIAYGRISIARDPKVAAESIASGVTRARALSDNDPINFEWKQTLVDGLLAQAAVAAAMNNAKVRATALSDALALTDDAVHRATDNAQWPAYYAEIQLELADVATREHDAATAQTARKAAREVLAPLAQAGTLSVQAARLYERAKP